MMAQESSQEITDSSDVHHCCPLHKTRHRRLVTLLVLVQKVVLVREKVLVQKVVLVLNRKNLCLIIHQMATKVNAEADGQTERKSIKVYIRQ